MNIDLDDTFTQKCVYIEFGIECKQISYGRRPASQANSWAARQTTNMPNASKYW